MTSCEITIQIAEVDATSSLTPDQWDDEGNRIEDMPDEQFQKLYDELNGKSKFLVRLTCNGKMRNIRSPIFSSDKRESVLQETLITSMKIVSTQFDNLCKQPQ